MRYAILISTTRKGNKMQVQADFVLKTYSTERGAKNFINKYYANDKSVFISVHPNKYETIYNVVSKGF